MSARRIHLEAVSVGFVGRSWTSTTRLRVGRILGLEVTLDDPSVSRQHAEVLPAKDGWCVRDLGSSNGTVLNRVRVGPEGQELHGGDTIRFGRVAVTVAFSDDSNQIRPNEAAKVAPISSTQGLLRDQNLDVKLATGQEMVVRMVTALAEAVELREKYTGGHIQRLTNYALLLAEKLELSSADRLRLRIGTPLHDIGKIGVDEAVLRKRGVLDAAELEVMRSHSARGAAILEDVHGLSAVLPIVRSHHERWDGLGYPDGLKGEDIPLLARVVAVADAFDAMTSDRPYRPSLPLEWAFAEIAAGSGSQFDPRCVEAFLDLQPDLEGLLNPRQSLDKTSETIPLPSGMASRLD